MSVHSVLNQFVEQKNSVPSLQNSVLMTSFPALVSGSSKPLFADSLLETTSVQRRQRMWASVFSMFVECLLVGLVIFISLWYTQVLPRQYLVMLLTPPSPPPAAAPPPARALAPTKPTRMMSNFLSGALEAPIRIPTKILMVKEPEPSASGFGVVGGVVGGVPGGSQGGVMGGILNGILSTPSRRIVVRGPQRVRISQGITAGMILSQVQPIYPAIAKAARIEGTVVLKAIIDKDGNIQNLQLASGSPLLAQAAVDAVRQWRYRPYLLDGQPVEVETTVQVIFQISQ